MDGFKDKDGCPENDNDEDGIPDKADACPNKPEDVDGFQDDDGCPDGDNDQDGIPDQKDGCPLVTEDLDGFEDADGCPEFDNDKDGVPDSTDKCPMVAEDVDSFEDEDGCPDIDNDKDGIVDTKDKCPNEPENVNGFEDEDGCPDKKKEVKKIEKTVTLRGVNFKTGSSELTYESHKILDGVVEQLVAYPEVEIEIRGHTDNVGSARSNQRLSERRAQSVLNYLASKGVAMKRMRATGYGENQPVAPNKTANGRRQNRRIEMYRTK
jgi:outer membrane protein OmpA-like peptidoglycan-associated protein